MIQLINTLSLTPDVREWLANTHHPRILHIFDHACNLINERREVLSIVTPQIGNGPFNLVVEEDVLFSERLNLQSLISNSPNHLNLGDFTINTADTKTWNPRPDWENLHSNKDNILNQLQIANYSERGFDTPSAIASHESLISNFLSALVGNDISTAKIIASKLAGLGIGLTPSGDDFIMGAIYAAWIIHPLEIACALANEIANTAAPLTTSLSAAWLKSAGKGEAGILWHNLFNTLIIGNSSTIELQITKLLSVGHTSGADALAGFFGTIISYAESETKLCPS